MANLKHAVPSSVRKPAESSRFAYDLMARSRRNLAVPEPRVVSVPMPKSRFMRLPDEPEDAKITGVTRSLTRRLLALNLPKVPVTKLMLSIGSAKIA